MSSIFQEFHIGRLRLGRIGVGKVEHFVSHVDSVREPGWPDPPRRQQYVDAAARAKVENGLTLPQLRHGGWVSATEAGRDRRYGDAASVSRVVED
jgi:hypothetical protein